MELSFVLAALRRRFWLVVLLAVVGGAAATSLGGGGTTEYAAVATLLVQPRSSANGVSSSSNPDRFIAGEVALLKGSVIASKVAAKVPGVDEASLATIVQVEQKSTTDVVNITVRTADAALSQQLANAYAQIYIAEAAARTTDSYNGDITEIDTKLADLAQKINTIEIERAKIPPNSTNIADRTRDAQLFEQTTQYRSQYTQLLAVQTNLEYSSTLKSRSEILQLAPLPKAPESSSKATMLIGGAFLGAVLGAAAVVAWGSSSRWLLDVVQLEEIIGAQVVGVLPKVRELASEPRAAFERLPDKTAAVIDQLCVRSEASAQGETDALAIAVVGSQRGAGVTTVALAMAGRLARNGARTVVIDGDLADPTISRSFDALGDAGIPGLLARLAAARNEPPPPGTPRPPSPESFPPRVFTPTSLPDVRVLGVGAPTKARSLHRTNADTVIGAAARGGVDVVVIDGGPLLDSASTVRLCQVVDVVVLVVPSKRQLTEPLGVITRLLGYRSGDLLPVVTKIKPKVDAQTKAVAAHEPSETDEIIAAATRWHARDEVRPTLPRWPAAPPAPPEPSPVPPPPTVGHTVRDAAIAHVPASPRLGAPPARRADLLAGLDDDDLGWVARDAGEVDRD